MKATQEIVRMDGANPVSLDESAVGVMAFRQYIRRQQYIGLGDASFTRRADWLRRYWQVFFILFLLTVVAVAATISL